MDNLSISWVIAIKAAISLSFLSFFNYVWIQTEPFTILWVLMFADMVTGISKQYILDRQLITSHRWWYGIVKKVYTLVGILSLALAIKWVGLSWETFLTITLSWFIGSELYSVIQNIYIFHSGKKATEFDATSFVFRSILRVIRGKMESEVNSITNTVWNSHEQSKSSKNEASSKQSEPIFGE